MSKVVSIHQVHYQQAVAALSVQDDAALLRAVVAIAKVYTGLSKQDKQMWRVLLPKIEEYVYGRL